MNRSRQQILTLAVILGLFTFVRGKAIADPCGMVPPIYLDRNVDLQRIGLQKTFVFYKDGVETFVIRPGFQGSVDEFGMLIPFPSPPALRKVADETFAHIAAAIDPPEVVIDLTPPLMASGFGGGLGFAESDESFAMEEEKLAIDSVQVLKQEAVGMYEVAVLKAGSAAALNQWMVDHGFRYPDGMDDVCNDYVKDGWCFVAVKAKVGQKDGVDPKPGMQQANSDLPDGTSFDGHVQGMGFRFKSDKLVVPMRLSAFNEGDLHNVVYLLTDEPMKARDLPDAHVVRQLSGRQLLENLTEQLPLRIIGGEFSDLSEGQRRGLKQQRDPKPHNGIARLLFAGDLMAASTGQLSHAHEELEKELLSIGEHLGLRGPEIDARHSTVLNQAREDLATSAMKDLRTMTMTVLDGDFEREVVAAKNVYFTAFEMPEDENDAEHYNARMFGPSVAGMPTAAITDSVPVNAVAMIHPTEGRIILQSVAGNPAVIEARLKVIGIVIGAALLAVILLVWRFRGRGRSEVGLLLLCCFVPDALAMPQESSPELLTVDQLQSKLSELHESADRSSDIDQISGLGEAVVPALLEVVKRGENIAERGWAVVCLNSIGSEAATDELRQIAHDKSLPPLVRIWTAASLIGQTGNLQELTPYMQLRSELPALQRPLELQVAALLSEQDMQTEDLLRLCASNPQLQQAASGLLLKTKPVLLAKVLVTSPEKNVRRQAAAWLATMKTQGIPGVNAAVIGAVKFEKAAEVPPWGDGPLFVPGVNWEKAEAIELINELTAWYLTCSKKSQPQQCSKIVTNLNSGQLMSAAGFWSVPSNILEWLTVWRGVIGPEQMDALMKRTGYRLVPTTLTPTDQ